MKDNTFNLSFVKYDPKLATILGRGSAIFISSLQFLMNNGKLGKERDGRKWIFYSVNQWADSLGYSGRQIERIVSKLRNKGIISIKKLSCFRANRTNYYTIDEEKLSALLRDIETQENSKDKPLSENTSSQIIKPTGLDDKMSGWSRHNGGIFTTKNTYKEDNKSEEKGRAVEKKSKMTNYYPNNQVKPVNEISLKKEKAEKQVNLASTKPTTAQDMLNTWNEMFPKAATNMSKSLAPLLVAAFKTKFNSDMNQWKRYCKMIASSNYLMGESFNLSIWWALKYSTIDRVNNLDFGVKEVSQTIPYSEKEALEHIRSVGEVEKCREVRLKLLKVYGPLTYKSWILNLTFFVEEGKVCFKAPTNFIKNHIKNNFWQVLEGL